MTRLVSLVILACTLLLGARGCTDCEKLKVDAVVACATYGESSPECLEARAEYKLKCEVAPTPTPPPPDNPCPPGQCVIGYTNTVPPTPICGECPVDLCEGVTCQPGYHCNPRTGECVGDVPPDPCDGITCDVNYHCEKGLCVPNNPPPPSNPCPKELAEGAIVYLNNKAYGNGFDSTVRVKGDTEFCRLIHGEAINDCHLEGWPNQVECEYYLLGGNCPVWEYKSSDVVYFCHDDHDALASCDHYGNPTFRDDPATPTTGDNLENLRGFEGEPKVCGLHRDEFGPMQGFFIIAHGKAEIRACKPNRDPNTCGSWKAFDH